MYGDFNMTRRVSYHWDEFGTAIFLPVCPKCGRFVKAGEVACNGLGGIIDKPNATCKKCGEVTMPFEGWE